MSQGRLLRQLIKAGARTEDEEFARVAEEVIRDERAKSHHLLANDLERLLYGTQEGRSRLTVVAPREIPKDRERSLPLLEVRAPLRDLHDIVLSDANSSVLDQTLLEQTRSEVFASFGLRPISRLLFCGPPGCGKTLAAEVIATELGLELVVIRFDAVVSSFLGETAANLGKVFDFIGKGRFVTLFDEFDAIGKEREDPSEHGELRRVVNSFLQMMDSYRGKSLLIAATNHERQLDRALWRRFDEVLVFDKPNLEQLRKLLGVKLRSVRHEVPFEDRGFLNQFTGLSHADVERVLVRAIKAMILKGREYLTADLVEEARRREEERLSLIAKL